MLANVNPSKFQASASGYRTNFSEMSHEELIEVARTAIGQIVLDIPTSFDDPKYSNHWKELREIGPSLERLLKSVTDLKADADAIQAMMRT